MKAKHYRKLQKALALIEQAQDIVEKLAAADPDFGHSANSTYRGSRIAAAVSILRTEVEQFAPCVGGDSYTSVVSARNYAKPVLAAVFIYL